MNPLQAKWCLIVVAVMCCFNLGHSFSFDRKSNENAIAPRGLYFGRSFAKVNKRASGSAGFLEIVDAPPKMVEARQHGKVALECSASGNPPPQITWFKDGRQITKDYRNAKGIDEGLIHAMSDTTSKLELNCVSEEDAGLYECVARSSKKKATVATELNVVSFKSNGCISKNLLKSQPPKINQWMGTYMQRIGSDAHLVCRSHGRYVSAWEDPNGDMIDPTNTQKYTILPFGDLIIHDLDFADMGVFKCFISNEYGDDSAETFVYPHAA